MNYRWTAPSEGAEVTHYNVYHIQDDGPAFLEAHAADTTFTLVAERGIRHRIRVSGVSQEGVEGPLSLASDELYIEIQQTSDGIPMAPSLLPNYPNPFNPETNIMYGIPATTDGGHAPVLAIYDVRGVLVCRLPVENAPGWHVTTWNGRDQAGNPRSSGQYILCFVYGGNVSTSKMTMLK